MRTFVRWRRNPVPVDVTRDPGGGNRSEAVMRKLLMLCAVLTVSPALAQDEGDSGSGGTTTQSSGGGGKAQKGPQSIDFEDDTIEGDLTKPDGEYVEARKKVQHSNLIRIREDFEDKVMQSVGEL
jgi:hypothetical protein